MPYQEEFDVYMQAEGVDATYNGQPLRVIFDSPYVESFGMASRQPTASLPTATSLQAGVAQGGVLVIGGATYEVRNVQPDGTGWTVLPLELQ
jgi:hypothetical protein